MMELAGTEGVLVSGGALTGKSVQFFDLESKRCVLHSLFILNLVADFILRKIIGNNCWTEETSYRQDPGRDLEV